MWLQCDVLVADRDAEIRTLITHALLYQQYKVISLQWEELDLQRLQKIQSSIIVIDVAAHTFESTIQMLEAFTQAIVPRQVGVLITATDYSLFAQATKRLTGQDCRYLPKPFALTTLFIQIAQLMRCYSSGS